ncbi:glycosyltransferase family 4 protein [Mesorhizobium sp. RP14(2022)]|uniref:Glycosyltransferase family 4 protein n=1 Tax=Mesorhizobium liriopis TaxID=2953882 RepID=A0ABT1C0N7_9HYPH|nr:glycosyltransferase family 4 protein [Mesorhizobium liriopis]MCO6048401.1 glycosyltransferase family 4 protein [Mesorhizobium liriopis]
MRLLFATSLIPDSHGRSGYEIASAAVIDALRHAGADVTVMGFAWPEQSVPDDGRTVCLGRIDVKTETASPAQKLAWLARAVRLGLPFAAAKLRTLTPETLREKIREAGPFDAYVLNAAQFASAFETVLHDRPTVFVAHNVEHRSAEENARAARNLFERLLYEREAKLLERVEARLCRSASHTFTFAAEDRDTLFLDPARSSMLPLVTRESAPEALPFAPRTLDAAMIGTWTWAPNRIGLDWFLQSVAPLLPSTFRIDIAGHVPADLTSGHPGIRFVGRVDDAEAFLASAAVVPLVSRAGTGVQLKTVETFELGLPTVATTHSLRGIDQVPDNCLIADNPRLFADLLIRFAREKPAALDGTAFFETQRAALRARVALVVSRLRSPFERAAA